MRNRRQGVLEDDAVDRIEPNVALVLKSMMETLTLLLPQKMEIEDYFASILFVDKILIILYTNASSVVAAICATITLHPWFLCFVVWSTICV